VENKYPRSRKDSLVVQEIDGEVLIYDLNDNKAFCLNKTSAIIWELCDGQRSPAEIESLASNKLKSPAGEGLIWLALTQLKKENLLENDVAAPAEYKGLSRREVIKRVGLGSVVAIPIVSSLVAPTGATAASAFALQATCTSSPQCSPAAPTCASDPAGGPMHCCVGTGGWLTSDGVIGGSEGGCFNPAPLSPFSTPLPQRDVGCQTDFGPQCCTGMSVRNNDSCNSQGPNHGSPALPGDWQCKCV